MSYATITFHSIIWNYLSETYRFWIVHGFQVGSWPGWCRDDRIGESGSGFLCALAPWQNFYNLILTFWSDFQADVSSYGGRSFAKEMVEKGMGSHHALRLRKLTWTLKMICFQYRKFLLQMSISRWNVSVFQGCKKKKNNAKIIIILKEKFLNGNLGLISCGGVGIWIWGATPLDSHDL